MVKYNRCNIEGNPYPTVVLLIMYNEKNLTKEQRLSTVNQPRSTRGYRSTRNWGVMVKSLCGGSTAEVSNVIFVSSEACMHACVCRLVDYCRVFV